LDLPVDARGGYECPLVTSDGMPPLKNKNATTGGRGEPGAGAGPRCGWDGFAARDGLTFRRGDVEGLHPEQGAVVPVGAVAETRPDIPAVGTGRE
jgi:hypothetical protein